MRNPHAVFGVLAIGLLSLVTPGVVDGQDAPEAYQDGPFAAAPVLDMPFSGRAVTTVTNETANGTVRKEVLNATYYRDSLGRVRVEQHDSAMAQGLVYVDANRADRLIDVVDASARTFWQAPRSIVRIMFGAGPVLNVPVAFSRYQVFRACSTGASAATDRSCAAAEVRSSKELELVTFSRRWFPGLGWVEYRLSQVSRNEPAPELFTGHQGYEQVSGAHGRSLLSWEHGTGGIE